MILFWIRLLVRIYLDSGWQNFCSVEHVNPLQQRVGTCLQPGFETVSMVQHFSSDLSLLTENKSDEPIFQSSGFSINYTTTNQEFVGWPLCNDHTHDWVISLFFQFNAINDTPTHLTLALSAHELFFVNWLPFTFISKVHHWK